MRSKISDTLGDLVCVLDNWKECEFRSQPEIYYNNELKEYVTLWVDDYGATFHKSLSATKSAIRFEHSVKGKTPKFKWKNIKTNES